MKGWSNHFKGSVYCIVGVLILSPDTLLLRLSSHVPNNTVLFSKYLISAAFLLLYTMCMYREKTLEHLYSQGKIGILAGLILGVSYVFFTTAVQIGIVANVLVIVASNSLFSALLSYVLFREVLPLRTLITCIVCFVAILLVFLGDLDKLKTAIAANMWALAATITLAMYFVALRYASLGEREKEDIDLLPCNIVAAITASTLSLIIWGVPVLINGYDAGLMVIQGVFTVSLSFGLLTVGPKYIPAPEVSLYMLIETVLGPVLVYLGGYEAPPAMTVYGGVILCVALTVNSVLALREEKAKREMELANGAAIGDVPNNGESINNCTSSDNLVVHVGDCIDYVHISQEEEKGGSGVEDKDCGVSESQVIVSEDQTERGVELV